MFLQDTDESGPASPKYRQCGHAITSIRFVTAVPGSYSVIECDSDIEKTIDKIREKGVKVGLVIKPKTPASAVFPYLDKLDLVLIMTVEPGFGGQSFMEDMLPKAGEIKAECERRGIRELLIEVDGGIGEKTIAKAAAAGIDVCVAGTAVFKAEDPAKAIAALQAY